jgi:cholesterol oxidase
MSGSAESGVIDSNFRVHNYHNFYITDGSVVQGNIGVNPSLTITALAEYAMNRIEPKDEYHIHDISQKLKLLEEEWNQKK